MSDDRKPASVDAMLSSPKREEGDYTVPAFAETSAAAGVAWLWKPSDIDLLAAVGSMALSHAHLDRALIGAIKTVRGISMEEATQQYERCGTEDLGKALFNGARDTFGEGETLDRIGAFVSSCKRVANLRNRFLHALWYQDRETDDLAIHNRGKTTAPPTAQELNDLTRDIDVLWREVQDARHNGYIRAATQQKP